jgi:hypothetical protein
MAVRLRLLHDDVAARLEPPCAAGLVDVHLDPVVIEDRIGLVVPIHDVLRGRHEGPDELDDLVVLPLVVDHEPRHVRGVQVADRPERERELGVYQARGLHGLLPLADRLPELHQVGHVGLQLLGRRAAAGGADDEAAAGRLGLEHDLAQALALLVVVDPARDARGHVGHEDEVAAGSET